MKCMTQSQIYFQVFSLLVAMAGCTNANRQVPKEGGSASGSVAALEDSSENSVHSAADSSESTSDILVGEVDSMTGNAATFGISTNQGLLLAIEEINAAGGLKGRKLKLMTLDAQGKAEESAQAISKFIGQDQVVAVFSGEASSHVLAMAPIAQKNAIPLVVASATNAKITEAGNFVFRTCFTDAFQGQALAKFAVEDLKLRKVALLKDIKSDHSTGLAEVFVKQFTAAGGQIKVEQSYSGGDIDFRSQLTAIRSKDVDAIVVPGYYTDISLIGRQARELGIKIPLLGGDGWDSPKLKEISGNSLNGSYFSTFYSPENPSPVIQGFRARYQQKYGFVPDGVAAMGYESAQVLFQALQKAKSLTRADVRNALENLGSVETLTGTFSFGADRNSRKSAVILKIDSTGIGHFFKTMNP